ncbi:MAG: ACP S-malonyltransferase [Thermodesulfobacteriota bacterium]
MIAFIFPGQGSQYVGMGKNIYKNFNTARHIFEEASDILNIDMKKLCFDGPDSEINLTANAQPAILTNSIAILNVIKEEFSISPDYVAGHSLGEYSALVSNNSIKFSDAVYTVRKRGDFMQDAVPVGVGAMAAILGLNSSIVDELCEQASNNQFIVEPANYNSPVQTVISGHKQAVEMAGEIAKDKGAKRVVPLDVSAPFHSSLMKPAAEKLSDILKSINVQQGDVPIVTNVNAQINKDSKKIHGLLVDQVVKPVRWTESIIEMYDSKVKCFIEIGPKNILSGLIRRTKSDVISKNIDNLEDIKGFNIDGI